MRVEANAGVVEEEPAVYLSCVDADHAARPGEQARGGLDVASDSHVASKMVKRTDGKHAQWRARSHKVGCNRADRAVATGGHDSGGAGSQKGAAAYADVVAP